MDTGCGLWIVELLDDVNVGVNLEWKIPRELADVTCGWWMFPLSGSS